MWFCENIKTLIPRHLSAALKQLVRGARPER